MRKLHEQKEETGDWLFILTKDEPHLEIRCHSEVLIQFKEIFGDKEQIEVKEFSGAVFKAMIDFMYLSEVTLDSNDLVEMLQLCQ